MDDKSRHYYNLHDLASHILEHCSSSNQLNYPCNLMNCEPAIECNSSDNSKNIHKIANLEQKDYLAPADNVNVLCE